MKKLCSRCGYINDYSASVCVKCGAELDKVTVVKRCPNCGKEFPVKTEECPDCRQTLEVSGTSAATVFDEKAVQDGIPLWVLIVGIFIPVIGIVAAWLYVLTHKHSVQRESAVQLCIVTLFGQLLIAAVIYIAVKIISGYIVRV